VLTGMVERARIFTMKKIWQVVIHSTERRCKHWRRLTIPRWGQEKGRTGNERQTWLVQVGGSKRGSKELANCGPPKRSVRGLKN